MKRNGGCVAVAEPTMEPGQRERQAREILRRHDALVMQLEAELEAKRRELVGAMISAQGLRYQGTAAIADAQANLEREIVAAKAARPALAAAIAPAREADREASTAAEEKLRHERQAEACLAEQHVALEAFARATDEKRAHLAQAAMLGRQHDLGPARRCVLLLPRGYVSSAAGEELRVAVAVLRGGALEASAHSS
jgi:hypothetical protein